MEERLLTTEDVAEYLRVEAVTVRRLVIRGELISYRIAGEYRFIRADVENYVRSQRIMSDPGQKDAFAKFTERARKVLSLANEAARRYNHDTIGPEHILLGIAQESEGVAAKALLELGIQENKIRIAVEELHPALERTKPTKELGMTADGKKAIELAVEEAQTLGHHYLGTEHLLLGLLRQEGSLAEQILSALGVSFEKARAQIIHILSAQQEPPAEEK